MRKNRSFIISYLASMEIGATTGLTRILVIAVVVVVVLVFFGGNDIFDCAWEGPWVSLAL